MNLTVTKTYDNWLTLLVDLVEGGIQLTYDQRLQLRRDAGNWPSCACGQLCSTLPRRDLGAPEDPQLYALGLSFNHHICAEDYVRALATFKQIEARSTHLLQFIHHSYARRYI